MKILTTVATLILLAAAGCVQEPETALTDTENIQELLRTSDLAAMTLLDGRGESGGGKDAGFPEHWWRSLISEGPVEFLLENDPASGICTVTVTRSLQASFNIDVTHDGVLNPGIKPISDRRTRRVILERTGDDTAPHGGWELTHITPAVHSLDSGLEQQVFVQSMRIYAGDELIWECDSPGTFYSVEEGLPVLEPGTLVRVEAEFLHTSPLYQPPFYAYVHGPCPVWPRHWMNDEGLWGDRVAGDGVLSYEWYVEGSSDRWFVAVDVIDADTMLDQEEDDYDSGAWGIPALKS